MIADPQRLYHVTANYFFWQGLRWVPIGALGLLQAVLLADPDWWPLAPGYEDRLLLAALAAAVVACKLIGDYYARTFGQVRGFPGLHHRRGLVKWFLVYPAMLASLVLDATLASPLFLSGPVWAGALLAYRWSTGGGRRHYLLAAAVLAALPVVPATGRAAPGASMVALLLGVMGMIYVIGGILDHLELSRVLRPVEEQANHAAV